MQRYISVEELDCQEYLLIIKHLLGTIVCDPLKIKVEGNVVFKLVEYFRCRTFLILLICRIIHC